MCVCLPRGVSDSLRKRGDTLIHTDGEIRVKHGRRCHCSLTPEKGTLPNIDVTVLSGRQQCSEDKQSPRTAWKWQEERRRTDGQERGEKGGECWIAPTLSSSFLTIIFQLSLFFPLYVYECYYPMLPAFCTHSLHHKSTGFGFGRLVPWWLHKETKRYPYTDIQFLLYSTCTWQYCNHECSFSLGSICVSIHLYSKHVICCKHVWRAGSTGQLALPKSCPFLPQSQLNKLGTCQNPSCREENLVLRWLKDVAGGPVKVTYSHILSLLMLTDDGGLMGCY